MAELASAYPTAGGLYYWASKMKNKNWGWWTAWLNLIGQFAIVAGIDYAAAGFINATIVDRITGGTFNTVEIIPGILNGQLVTMGVILAIQLTPQHRRASTSWRCSTRSASGGISGSWRSWCVLIFLTGKPDQSGLDAVPDPAAGHGRQLEQQSRLPQPPIRAGDRAIRSSSRSSSRCCWPTGPTPAMTHRRTSPRRRSEPGWPAPGASSCRSPSARSSATSSWSR